MNTLYSYHRYNYYYDDDDDDDYYYYYYFLYNDKVYNDFNVYYGYELN